MPFSPHVGNATGKSYTACPLCITRHRRLLEQIAARNWLKSLESMTFSSSRTRSIDTWRHGSVRALVWRNRCSGLDYAIDEDGHVYARAAETRGRFVRTKAQIDL